MSNEDDRSNPETVSASKIPQSRTFGVDDFCLITAVPTFLFSRRLNAFLEGFYDIIPKRLISIFNEQELELLISGLPNVDIEDLKANTEYHKYSATSLQVRFYIS